MAAGGSIPIEFRVDELEGRLRSKLETLTGFADESTQAHELNKIFRFFNADKDGFLSLREFEAALVRLNVVGMQREVRALFERYDLDGSGFVSYEEVSAAMLGLIPNPLGDPVCRSAVDRVRHKIAERGGMNGIRTLGRIFRSMDDTGNHKLDREELLVGLREYGVDLSDKEGETVLSVFDRNGDGIVDFDELLRGLRGRMSPKRRELVQMAFDVMDKDGSGQITVEDLATCYDASQHPDVISGKITEEEALGDFLTQWDTLEEDGIVTRAEFLEYWRDISASIDPTDDGKDSYFELVIRNAFRISGGEGQAENTANLRVLVVHSDGEEEVVEVKDSLGVDTSSFADIKSRLERQGVSDIADIKLGM